MRLQAGLARLTKDVKKLNKTPSITVEKLEYKFDQLKVETLEGTLNIGLNPADLKQIEDLAVPPSSPPAPIKSDAEFNELLANRLNQYIEGDLKQIIYEVEEQTGAKLSPQHLSMIQEDLRKQLPARTEHYIQFFTKQSGKKLPEENLLDKLYQTMTMDMNQAVRTFISQSNSNKKGIDNDGT